MTFKLKMAYNQDPASEYTNYKRGLAHLASGLALATAGAYTPEKLVKSIPLLSKAQTVSTLGSVGLIGYGLFNMAKVPLFKQPYYNDRLIKDVWISSIKKTAGTLDTFKGATNIPRPFNIPKGTTSAPTTTSTLVEQKPSRGSSLSSSTTGTSISSPNTKTAAICVLANNYLSKTAAAQGRYIRKKKVPYRGPRYNPEWDMFKRKWSTKINIPNTPKPNSLSNAGKAGLALAALGTLGVGLYGMHKKYTNDI